MHLEDATEGRCSEADHGHLEASIAELPSRQTWAGHSGGAWSRSTKLHRCEAMRQAESFRQGHLLQSETCTDRPRQASINASGE